MRAHVLKGNTSKSKPFHILMTGPDQANNCSNPDDNSRFFAGIEPFTPTSIEFLNQILADPEPFRMLVFDSFVPLEENSPSKPDAYNGQKFDTSLIISKTELKAQIYYDLCAYYIFIKKYELGREMIISCRDNIMKLKEEYAGRMSELKFCTVTEQDLNGHLAACGVFDQEPSFLFQRFNESILNNSKHLEVILSEDNIKREIPIMHRKTLEVDLEQPSNESLKLLALNSIRSVLEDSNILTSDIITLKLKKEDKREIFLRFFVQVINADIYC